MKGITLEEFNELMVREMPWAINAGLVIEKLDHGTARVRLPFSSDSLRPGGTLSGPSMMMLADTCMYAVVLSVLGSEELAVTTNFNINFLRKPHKSDIESYGRLLKLGRRLAVIEVTLNSLGMNELVAHATGTYSIPPTLKT